MKSISFALVTIKKNLKSHTREMPFDHQNFEKSVSKSSSIKKHKLLVLERRNFIVSNLDTHWGRCVLWNCPSVKSPARFALDGSEGPQNSL